jgi:putative chitinase
MTDEQLKAIMPQSTEANRQKYLPFLNQYMQEYGIMDGREAAFVAQIGHESAQLRYVEEIASGAAYEGRKDLGNTQPGDGKRFKGRGLIQITGRKNYKQISDAWNVDFIAQPELLATPEYAVKSACWWYKNNVLEKLQS